MKKFFFFAAAALAAMSLNAASFVGFDGRAGDLGTQIFEGGLIQNQDNITLNETDASAHKYEIKITTGGECSFTMGGVEFWYSNSNDGTVAYKTFGTYIQPNGNKRRITIPTKAGEKVLIYTPEVFTVAAEGVQGATTVTTVAWGDNKDQYVEVVASGSAIVLWSDDRTEAYSPAKIKLGAVLPAEAEEGIEELLVAPKASKVVYNGQVVIVKEGRMFNLLGAEIMK